MIKVRKFQPDGLVSLIQTAVDISFTKPRWGRLASYYLSLNPARQRIFTEANLYDHDKLQLITECADQILSELENMTRDKNIPFSPDVELVLELVPWNKQLICGYYFVEHNSRCLFWLEGFDAKDLCGIKAVVSLSHLRKSGFPGLLCALLIIFSIGYEIESQYWWVIIFGKDFAEFWPIHQDTLGIFSKYSRRNP